MRTRVVVVIVLLVLASGSAWALDPERRPSQYLVERWGLDRGWPGGIVHAITQTGDGHLWLGTDKGLVRFDGTTFRLLVPPIGPAGRGPGVLDVAAAPDGSVWLRLRGPSLLRYDGQAFETLMPAGRDYVVFSALEPTRRGMLVTPLGQGVLQVQDGQVTTRVKQARMSNSFVLAIAEATDGALWLGTRDAGLLRLDSTGQLATITDGLPDRKVNVLQSGPSGDMWVGTDAGVVRWVDGRLSSPSMAATLPAAPVLALARDRDRNLWVAFGAGGLARITAAGEVRSLPWDARRQGDVTALFEDRDGHLWVGTSRGLERWRDGAFRTWTSAQGLPADTTGPLHVDASGRVWLGSADGGLFWTAGGVTTRVTGGGFDEDIVYSLAGRGDEVWVGRQRGGLSRVTLDRGATRVTRFTTRDGLAQDQVFAVTVARDGAVWAGTLSGGVSRVHDGAIETLRTEHGLASNTVSAIVETADGTMWFGTPAGLSARTATGWRHVTTRDGLPSGEVTSLFEDRRRALWVGTARGLAVLRGGRVTAIDDAGLGSATITGIAEDLEGGLWVATTERLVRLQGLDGAVSSRARAFGVDDGLAGVEGVRRHRSLVTDARGAVWFASPRGVSQVYAPGLRPPTGATVTIAAVTADAEALPRAGTARVPAGTRRLTVEVDAAKLVDPARLRFRYRLDGFDADWSAPTASRDVAYTNLRPGDYTLRVQAVDGDGAPDGPETRLALDVAAALWQQRPVQGFALLALVGAGWGAYRWRVRQVAARLAVRYEERLAERTRIAQDLHDTLLQSGLSATMQLHLALDQLPSSLPQRPLLERVLALLRRANTEGRAAVGALRSESRAGDAIEAALARTLEELAAVSGTGYRVVVEGRSCALRAIVRDEVYRIGREGIANAVRHAGAQQIDVEVQYDADRFRLVVRDDGRGMPAEVVERGREGHWGLRGMRERAAVMRGTFRVMSRPDAGTEIELVVPGRVAFAEAHSPRRWWRGRHRPPPPERTDTTWPQEQRGDQR